ncbi:MBL fold metallo-hydrolase [uncultured Selenomonas sp.]|uniref:MBL fold metallo-hydrolase n=1 Tax=uncultured Selenomonas sp. TaxID=159275 RepID=UPI0025D7DC61|nr:MBL fold metallo-hydrolase [uncultured Selenomonas sp.]
MKQEMVPMRKTQVPGFYRILVGDCEVTALSDGLGKFTPDMCTPFTSRSAEELSEMWDAVFGSRATDGTPEVSVNAFLVHTGDHLILIDAGKGDAQGDIFFEKQGLVLENLVASGYAPEDVDILLPTHLHTDHINGIASHGKRMFPHATLYLAEPERDYWLDSPLGSFPEGFRPSVQGVRDAVDAYRSSGCVKWYQPGEEIVPRITSVPLFGHTPGHSGFLVESRDEKLLVWGDMLHLAALQLEDPEIGIVFDADVEAARETRKKMLPRIAAEKRLVAGSHLSFPGFGHIRCDGDGYRYIPLEYRRYVR